MDNPTLSLTQEQIDFFHANGYLALDSMTTATEISWLIGVYDRLFAENAGREEGNQYDLAGTDEDDKPSSLPQIVNPVKYAPELQDILLKANAMSVAQQLQGPSVEAQGEFAIMKPPQMGAPAPWHQDEAYWKEELEYNSISIWVPLQEATMENGCMQFIPQSHKGDVLPHHPIGHDPRIHGLEVDACDASSAVACPLPAGGATIHHCRTLHYTGPNRSSGMRRAYVHTFAAPYVKRSEARDFYWQKQRRTARDERRAQAGTVSTSSGRIQ
jgi:ectoine hydroxylase-related dioxygenase (phytanoyl-CoA dioxygenase family)